MVTVMEVKVGLSGLEIEAEEEAIATGEPNVTYVAAKPEVPLVPLRLTVGAACMF